MGLLKEIYVDEVSLFHAISSPSSFGDRYRFTQMSALPLLLIKAITLRPRLSASHHLLSKLSRLLILAYRSIRALFHRAIILYCAFSLSRVLSVRLFRVSISFRLSCAIYYISPSSMFKIEKIFRLLAIHRLSKEDSNFSMYRPS